MTEHDYNNILKRIEEILKNGIKDKNDNKVRKYNIHAEFVDEEKTKADAKADAIANTFCLKEGHCQGHPDIFALRSLPAPFDARRLEQTARQSSEPLCCRGQRGRRSAKRAPGKKSLAFPGRL